ncbi:MAG: glycine/sarcosine/betaine reductase complex component C subunit beta [Thermovirgaceae bacterium]|nr:glycine/sarcosine/betaine reductase complex component C subunit beta [Thermovirgaceae bacterium]
MAHVAIRGYSYCLNHTPELGLHYGNTPYMERKSHGETEFIKKLPDHVQSFDEACCYPPNQVYIGGMDLDALVDHPAPMYLNRLKNAPRFGKFGEIMPENEFLGLMDICDVFDLIWLDETFASDVSGALAKHPVMNQKVLSRLEKGHASSEIEEEVSKHGALPLYFQGKIAGCCRKGHDVDESLSAHVLLENIASKAGSVLALLHLLKSTELAPGDVDYVIECSEEAAGDMNQRGGGNFAKAVAEIAGCTSASGYDVRSFCAAPVNAMIAGAAQVASGARPNVVVLAGGAIPKLFMNSRDHVKKGMPALEDCLGNFAILLDPDDGTCPVMRLDALGKHSVGAGSSPQAITSALVLEPLQKLGLTFSDVDKFAAELQIPEITVPAGAGDVPVANFKMIAALAVMKGQLTKEEMPAFVKQKGIPGFAHTQGHIPSGVPFIGHACEAIAEGKYRRVMIIGKGSLFLARLTNLSDGASFIIEPGTGSSRQQGVTREDVREILLEALSELSKGLTG